MSHCPVAEFDHHSPDYVDAALEVHGALRESAPVAWSEEHGGYWVVSSYELAASVLRDHETFSSAKVTDEGGQVRGGLNVPTRDGFRFIPDESDPPEWNMYRRLLNPLFSPSAIDKRTDLIHQVTVEMMDRVIESGRTDLVADLTNPITGVITLKMIGLSLHEWRALIRPFHLSSHIVGADEFNQAEREAFGLVYDRVNATIAERRLEPRDDIISYLLEALDEETTTSDGATRLQESDIADLVAQLLAGGISTTTALLGHTFIYLEGNQDLQDRLVGDGDYLRIATEELVRWTCPVTNLARTVTKPVELAGAEMEPGERVLVSYLAANHDPAAFDRPDEIVLDRFPNRHAGFGIGLHRCLGSNLARAIFREVLPAVLVRMKGYVIDHEHVVANPNISSSRGYANVPISFPPGPRLGSGLEEDLIAP